MKRGVLGPALLAAALGAGGILLARAAEAARDPAARAAEGVPPLGVLNAIGVDLLWIRADALYAEDRWPEMLAAYEAAGRLEPRLAAAWEYRGFHLAWNLAGDAATPADRDRWIVEGARVLDDGLRRNPGNADLRFWLGRLLLERPRRWPAAGDALRRARGREPLDEAIGLLGDAAAAAPDDGRVVLAYADALVVRALRALQAAPRDAPCPAALQDLRIYDLSLERFSALLPAEGRDLVGRERARVGVLRDAAAGSDAAARERALREFAPEAGEGK